MRSMAALVRARMAGIPGHHFGTSVPPYWIAPQRGHCFLPRHITGQEIAEAGERSDALLEILDVHAADALAEEFDPVRGCCW